MNIKKLLKSILITFGIFLGITLLVCSMAAFPSIIIPVVLVFGFGMICWSIYIN